MHDVQGFFCKTADPGKITKFTDLGKNLNRPNLSMLGQHKRKKEKKEALQWASPWAKPKSVEEVRPAGARGWA